MYIMTITLLGVYILGFAISATIFISLDDEARDCQQRTGVFGCLLMALFWPLLALVVLWEIIFERKRS